MENENQFEDVSSYGFEPDISMPEIPMPTASEKKEEINKDECSVAFKFGFIGAGQGGARIGQAFHKLGYRKVCAVNTAQQDLNTIALDEKQKLCIGEGGAGKDPSIAENKFLEKREDVLDLMQDSFGDSVD